MREISAELCVIGAGPGGLTVASAASQLGRNTVLIEKGKMGGDCLNHGCVPSKALIAAARHAHAIRSSPAFGVDAGEPEIDFAKVMSHVDAAIAAIAPDDAQEKFEKLGCTVLREQATFIDREKLRAGETVVKARRFVIAAGSSPAVPAIEGLAGVPYLTSDSIFANRILPSRLVILGAGPMGLEMAQAFRRLGAEVTLIETLEPLASEDRELAHLLLEMLTREGVRIMASAKVKSVRGSGLALSIDVETQSELRKLEASHLLIAAGRRPNVDGLGLAEAGVDFDENGIKVDARLRTTNHRIYAIGDIRGGLQFTHVAAHQASLVVRNALFRQPVHYDPSPMPRVVFTDPQLAQAGLTEAQAAARGISSKVLRWPLGRSDRARIEGRAEGLFKIVLDRASRVIGAGILAPEAGELILPWTQMIASRQRIAAMANVTAPYPTLSEDSRKVALTNYAGISSNPWLRRALDMLSSFG
jgi:pyruvate/2-oxoglutarate dehydrogenase complex dihydrolipoamide dehydrogenase (E3) component